VNPNNKKINPVAPPVRIEKIVLDGKPVQVKTPLITPLVLVPDIKKIEFHYTALSLSEPRRVKFKYILAGFETHWVASGERKITSVNIE
jgi:hypothetical protein